MDGIARDHQFIQAIALIVEGNAVEETGLSEGQKVPPIPSRRDRGATGLVAVSAIDI